MTSLQILSGGAAQGLVAALAVDFKSRTGCTIAGDFGAVGAMADRLRSGAPADLVVLTAALIAKLADEELVVPSSIANVGLVETALAVRRGDPLVAARDVAELRGTLLAADAIYVPDIENSTAGIHVAKVLRQLGIMDAVWMRLQVHPNGATAMGQLARSAAAKPIGCTQSTEIIGTPGIIPSGPLPAGCQLETMYTAAVTTQGKKASQARALIELLTSDATAATRRAAGFIC
jgi:molybdate transport system substrate-binding protein